MIPGRILIQLKHGRRACVCERFHRTKEKGPDKEDPFKFKDYIEAKFLPKEEGIYDYISVDGRVDPCRL